MASFKHLASVHNPEFHQREQLRLSTWNTPRMVRCYEEDIDRLHLPRGLLDEAAKILESAGSKLEVDDQRPARRQGRSPSPASSAPPRMEPSRSWPAMSWACSSHRPERVRRSWPAPSSQRLSTPTLVLVHTKPLAEQWRQRLGRPARPHQKREIGQLGAGRTRRSGIVDLMTLQTLARRDDAAEVFDGYGLVVVDECHHLPAVSIREAACAWRPTSAGSD